MKITVRFGNFGRELCVPIPVNLERRNDAIRAMASNGLTACVIASRMGMSLDRVRQIGRGLFRGPVPGRTGRDATIVMAVQNGRTLRDVAREYDLTPQRIHQIVTRSRRGSNDPR